MATRAGSTEDIVNDPRRPRIQVGLGCGAERSARRNEDRKHAMTTVGVLAVLTARVRHLLSVATRFGATFAIMLALAACSSTERASANEHVASARAASVGSGEPKVFVTPTSAQVTTLDSFQFAATSTESGALTWSVREPCGGTVTSSGLYTAPALPGSFHVDVRNAHHSSWQASALVTVVPPPRIIAFSASATEIDYGGTVSLSITFADGSAILLPSGMAVASAVMTLAPTSPIDYTLRVTNAAGKAVEQTIHVDVHTIAVDIIPAAASLTVGDELDLLADVQGALNPAVSFSVVEGDGGSVDANGTYEAPPVPGTFHVLATSVTDPSKSATATITVFPEPRIDSFGAAPPSVDLGATSALNAIFEGGDGIVSPAQGAITSGVPVSVRPEVSTLYRLTVVNGAGRETTADAAVAVHPVEVELTGPAIVTIGRPVKFTASVTGAVDTTVQWSVGELTATIDGTGTFAAQQAGTFHVVVTSLADPQVNGTAAVQAVLPPVIQSFFAAPQEVDLGHTVELTATFSGGAGSVQPKVGAVSSGEGIEALPTDTTTYTLTVTNDAGDIATASVDVGVRLFQAVGSLKMARQKLTATALQDGRVLVVGGVGVSGLLGSLELFDPSNGAFEASPAVVHPRAGHVATLLPDGRVVITGGNGGSALTPDEPVIEVFDPATGAVTAAGQLVTPRHDHAVTRLGSGKLLISGGLAADAPLDAAEIWDPETSTSSPLPRMTTPRAYHSATVIPDGRVLLAGGAAPGAAGTYVPLATAELFDPTKGSFAAVTGLAQARYGHTATLRNSVVYVVGGKGPATDGGYLGSIEALPISKIGFVPPPAPAAPAVPAQLEDDADPGPPTWDPDSAPVQFVASGVGVDDGPAIQQLLDQGARHVQFIGSDMEIDTPIRLASENVPYNGTILEPLPGNGAVTIHTNIGTNPNYYPDITYTVFGYEGSFALASRTASPSASGDVEIRVEDSSWYEVGNYVAIADGATNGTLIEDGAAESRRVVAIGGHVLRFDRPLRRPHGDRVAVSLSAPLFGVQIRDFVFTGDVHVGIHLQNTQDCLVERITSRDWTGGFLMLYDTPGQRNVVRDTYCTGTNPGLGDGANAWGISLEGQEDSRVYDSGAELCGVGIVVNYGIDTLVQNAHAERNTVNLFVNGDTQSHGSLRSGFIGGEADSGVLRGVVVGPGSVESLVDVDLHGNAGYGVDVGPGATRTQIGGAISNMAGRTSIGVLLRGTSYHSELASFIHDNVATGVSVEADASWLQTAGLVLSQNSPDLVEAPPVPDPSNLRQPRARHVALERPDGTVALVGGVGKNVLALIEVFDPAQGTFEYMPPSLQLHPGGAVVELHDGRVMMIGGVEKDAIADCEISSF
jgi:Galactose oxidase, central domain